MEKTFEIHKDIVAPKKVIFEKVLIRYMVVPKTRLTNMMESLLDQLAIVLKRKEECKLPKKRRR